jgi:putative solute:sodium symporter small subunit
MSDEPAAREVIRTPTLRGADRGRPPAAELYRQDAYGRTFLAALMRAQLAVTLSVLVPAAAILALYPLLAVLVPRLDRVHVLGLPLALLVLGGGIYPPLVLLGFWYVRRTEQLERRFVELLEDRD